MGTPVSAKELVVNEYPLYLESGLSAEKLGKVISSGLSQSNTFPLNATLIIKGAKSVGFKLSNLTGTAVSGKLEVLTSGVFTGKKTVAIPTITAESNSIINFNAIKAIGPRSMPVKIKVSDSRGKSKEFVFDLRSILVPYAAKKLTIDGNLADWPKTAKPVMLDSSNAKKLKGWTAPFDQIKAEVLLAWDDEYLYVAVSSNKKTYAENSRSSGSMWRGDGLQIAYDPLHNAVEKTTGYQDDDYEFSIGRFKGKALVYMHCASAATYDSLDKPIGSVPGVKRAIKTTKNGTVYELAFPRILVSPFRLEPDSSMRFNLILNINNGKKRVGWLELTPGIGQTPKKPGLFMDIVLTK